MPEKPILKGSKSLHSRLNNQKLIAGVLSFAGKSRLAPGDPVMAPDTKAEVFYYLEKGRVEVSYIAACQTKISVAFIGAGEFFGEIGFFDRGSRVRTIVASEDVEIAVFTQDVMDLIREQETELYIDFLLYLTRKICTKFRRIAGETSPVAAYADSFPKRRSAKYIEAKPLPSNLLRSDLWHIVQEEVERISMDFFNMSLMIHDASGGLSDEKIESQCMEILNRFADSMPLLEEQVAGSGYEDVMWGYVFKEVYPYFMRSRHAERSYHKPKGYAGDFLMIEHIYENVPKGDGKIGKMVDAFCLQRPSSRAIRGRRRLLAEQLSLLSAPLAKKGNRIAIMNLACGPNRELFDFLRACEYSERIEALCIDIDSEALQYTNKYVNTFPHLAAIRLMKENVVKWALGRTRQYIPPQNIIYSAGLCDYLDDRLFKALITRCYDHLKPGGTLILGNMAKHPDAVFMDRILRWELIYRNSEQLEALFADTPFGTATVVSEEEHVNLFALAVKK